MFESWRIRKSSTACCRCGEEFADGQPLFSCLVEEEGEWARQDYCRRCWEGEPDREAFCFWRSRRAAVAKKPVVDTELMMQFFDRLDNPDSDRKKAFRFVLALYLMRRKELKLVQVTHSEGREELTLQKRATSEQTRVESPGLTEEQVQQTATQLNELLDADL